ncbi:MAG: transglycosylase SLT domain-containing protein [Flavobacterium sp.]|nr:transglycosylase SLT domain-containing protein [Pedobacter sp.]
MMKKIGAVACFLFAGITVFANGDQNLLDKDTTYSSITVITNNEPSDSLLQNQLFPNPLLSYQNLVYKQRLDSLESSVKLSYNEHVQDYIDLYVFKRKTQIGKMIGLSDYYFPIFEKSLREVGIPDELKYISIVESALNPQAVSRSGAVGPWQFMYTTAKGYGLKMDNYVDERKDPVQASYAAALYLKDAYNRLGDWLLAIAAYNCGAGAVSRAITRSGGEADFWKVRPYLPRETQNYVPAFIATVYAMKYYQKHDIIAEDPGFNILTEIIDVNRVISLSNIARAANVDLSELLLLNPSYKKKIINGSPAYPKQLVIPVVEKQVYTMLYDVLNGTEILNEPSITAVNNLSHQENQINVPASHKVKDGQTILMVANQYGLEVQDLKVLNNFTDNPLVPGQVVKLKSVKQPLAKPSKSSRYFTYIVKAGDTLSEIAEKFTGNTISKIKAQNGLNKNLVKPGMKLIINKS